MTRIRRVQERRITHILEITGGTARNTLQLAEMMCLSPYRVREYIKQLRKDKALYIEKWGSGPNPATPPMAFFRRGNLPDAVKPAPKEVPAPSRKRKAATGVSSDVARELRQREKDKRRALERAAKYPIQQHSLVNALFGRPAA